MILLWLFDLHPITLYVMKRDELLRTAALSTIILVGAIGTSACEATPSAIIPGNQRVPTSAPAYHPTSEIYHYQEPEKPQLAIPNFDVSQSVQSSLGFNDTDPQKEKQRALSSTFSSILEKPLSSMKAQFDTNKMINTTVHISANSSTNGYNFFATSEGNTYSYVAVKNNMTAEGGIWVRLPNKAILEKSENNDLAIFQVGDILFTPMFRDSSTGVVIDPTLGILMFFDLPKVGPNRDNYPIASNNYIMHIREQLYDWLRHRALLDRIIGQYSLNTVLNQLNQITAVITETDQNGFVKQFAVNPSGYISAWENIPYHPQPLPAPLVK